MCDDCGKKRPTTGAVLNGKFQRLCSACLSKAQRITSARSAQYARDRDRDAHEADLIQPWTAKGEPNKEFIRIYPEEAHDTFTKEELEKYG